MEKYGVDTVDTVKTSETISVRVRCPSCGASLEANTNVLKCPQCGTEPFEPPEKSRP